MPKQTMLKPQDLLVALKLAADPERDFTYATLGAEIDVSSSEAHASVKRAAQSGLLTVDSGAPRVVRSAIEEFVLHGVRYSFPATYGPVSLGLPTSGHGPVLKDHFAAEDPATLYVWPDSRGTVRGTALYPLYPSVVTASIHDQRLYELLTLVDAVRAGSARERELAVVELRRRIP